MVEWYVSSSRLDRNQRKFSENRPYFISLKLVLSGHLEEKRLNEAVRRVIGAVPVLGCCYAGDEWESGWIRQVPLPENRIRLTDEAPERVPAYLQNLEPEPLPLQVVVCRREFDDVLIFSIDHTLTDAHGLFDLVKLIAETYTTLKTVPDFTPCSLPVSSDRSHTALFSQLSYETCRVVAEREAARRDRVSPYQKFFSLSAEATPEKRLYCQEISRNELAVLKETAHEAGATIHDVLLALYGIVLREYVFRETRERLPVVPLRSSMDLRKYFSSGMQPGLTNCSISYWAPVPFSDTAVTYASVLRNVCRESAYTKHYSLGVGTAFGIEEPSFAESEPYQDTGYYLTPFLSNVGILSGEVVDFGEDIRVRDACIYANFRAGNPWFITALTWDDVVHLTIFTDRQHDLAKWILKRFSGMVQEICEMRRC